MYIIHCITIIITYYFYNLHQQKNAFFPKFNVKLKDDYNIIFISIFFFFKCIFFSYQSPALGIPPHCNGFMNLILLSHQKEYSQVTGLAFCDRIIISPPVGRLAPSEPISFLIQCKFTRSMVPNHCSQQIQKPIPLLMASTWSTMKHKKAGRTGKLISSALQLSGGLKTCRLSNNNDPDRCIPRQMGGQISTMAMVPEYSLNRLHQNFIAGEFDN